MDRKISFELDPERARELRDAAARALEILRRQRSQATDDAVARKLDREIDALEKLTELANGGRE